MKHFTQKIFALAVFLVTGGAAISQTAFWTENFSGGTVPTSWTNEDPSGNMAFWTWCADPASPTGNGCPGVFTGIDPFSASTVANGFVTMNSDALGDLTTDHVSQLTTASIDCSGQPMVWLSFETQIGVFTIPAEDGAIVKVSNDDGVTWTSFTVFPGFTALDAWSGNPLVSIIDISSVAANQANVKIQWEWTGNYEYVWNLDDIGLYNEDPTPPSDPNLIWGGPNDPNGSFDGGLNDWTVNAVSDPDALWVWDVDGIPSQGAYSAGIQAIQSPSVANGVALFDSDFYDNGGTAGNFGNGLAAAPQASELISPVIDLTNHPYVSLQFNQYTRQFNSDFSIAWSADGGTTWSEPIVINENIPVNTGIPRNDVQLIPLIGAGGSSQFRFKFVYDANYYFWMIDDVAIVKRANYDLSLGDFFFSPASFAQPISQIATDTMGFSVDVSNIGAELQSDIKLKVEILRGTNLIYSDSLTIDALMAEEIDTTYSFDQLFIPDNLIVGNYTLRYSISSANADFRPANNVRSASFRVTDNSYAKEDGDLNTQIAWIFGSDHFVANLYRTSDNWVDEYLVKNITFSGAWNDNNPALNKSVNFYLMRIKDEVAGPNFENFDIQNTDLLHPAFELRGTGSHTFVASNGEYAPINANIEDVDFLLPGVKLDPGQRYFLMAEYTGDANSIYQVYNQKISYFQTSTVLMFPGDQWYFGGVSPEDAAVLRMEIDLINTTDEKSLPESAFSFFPNPASQQLNVQLALEKPALANVTIADLNGRVILIDEIENASGQNREYDVSQLPSGTYLVRVATKEGTKTKKFVVAR